MRDLLKVYFRNVLAVFLLVVASSIAITPIALVILFECHVYLVLLIFSIPFSIMIYNYILDKYLI